MTKYNVQSAEVLNEADRFERTLNWHLFCMEQENMLFGYNPDEKWVPGVPLHPEPVEYYDFEVGDYEMRGNWFRPMIEIIGLSTLDNEDGTPRFIQDPTMDHRGMPTCEDCQVSWDQTKTSSCWMCGKEYPIKPLFAALSEILRRRQGRVVPYEGPRGQIEGWNIAGHRASESMERMRDQLHYYAAADAQFTREITGHFLFRDFRLMPVIPRNHGRSILTRAFAERQDVFAAMQGAGRVYRAPSGFRRAVIDEWLNAGPTETDTVTVRVSRYDVESLPDLELFPTVLNLDGDQSGSRRRDVLSPAPYVERITIPREIPEAQIPLPELETEPIVVHESLLDRTYPTSHARTQERRSRN